MILNKKDQIKINLIFLLNIKFVSECETAYYLNL